MAYLTTVPPAEVHSWAEDFMFQPMPLQLLRPLHSFLAVLQSDVPLQVFTPEHLTDMSSACAMVMGVLIANKAAAVLAIARADLKVVDMVIPLMIKTMRQIEMQSGLVRWKLFASACLHQSGQNQGTYIPVKKN
jgi:hypothetical protein